MATFVGVTDTQMAVVGAGLSLTVRRNQSEVAGDLMFATLHTQRSSSFQTITPPAGWDLVDTVTFIRDSTGENHRASIYKRIFVVGDPVSWIWTRDTQDGQPMVGIIVAYRPGANEEFRSSNKQADTTFGATVDAPSLNAGAAGLLCCIYNVRGITTPNSATLGGLTERHDQFEISQATGIVIGDTPIASGGATGVKTATRDIESFMGAGWALSIEGPVIVPATPLVIRPDRGKPIDVASPRMLKDQRHYKPFVRVY